MLLLGAIDAHAHTHITPRITQNREYQNTIRKTAACYTCMQYKTRKANRNQYLSTTLIAFLLLNVIILKKHY